MRKVIKISFVLVICMAFSLASYSQTTTKTDVEVGLVAGYAVHAPGELMMFLPEKAEIVPLVNGTALLKGGVLPNGNAMRATCTTKTVTTHHANGTTTTTTTTTYTGRAAVKAAGKP